MPALVRSTAKTAPPQQTAITNMTITTLLIVSLLRSGAEGCDLFYTLPAVAAQRPAKALLQRPEYGPPLAPPVGCWCAEGGRWITSPTHPPQTPLRRKF